MWIEGPEIPNPYYPDSSVILLTSSARANNSKTTCIANIQEAAARKGLHGFFHYGHGGGPDFGTTIYYKRNAFYEDKPYPLDGKVCHIGPHVRIDYSAIKPSYELGVVIIYACLGSAGDAQTLVSSEPNRVFIAWDDVISPNEFINEDMMQYFPDSKQGTNHY